MYEYMSEREKLFTDEGQRTFLAIRDRVHRVVREAGVITMGAAIRGGGGDSWLLLACVDRLVELGEIVEVPQGPCPGQDRVFCCR